MSLEIEAILFDFDGTIIDSYPGIQRAFDEAYFLTYSVTNKLSVQAHIGPPVGEILTRVHSETNPEKINSFINFFKKEYDTEAYKSSILYDGMMQLFETLKKKNIRLFLITNKREKPTKLIAQYLRIDHFFSGIYSSDSKEHYTSKSFIVNELLQNENISQSKCCLVGDTEQDKAAAEQNNITFVYAEYGYGNLINEERIINAPGEILKYIK